MVEMPMSLGLPNMVERRRMYTREYCGRGVRIGLAFQCKTLISILVDNKSWDRCSTVWMNTILSHR
jgi:hypothetical protein